MTRQPVLSLRRVLVRFVLTIVGLTIAGLALFSALELALTPWARSVGLWPTLTGHWSGELRTADGRTHPVYFEIRGGLRNGGHSYIGGRGRFCIGTATQDFDLSGKPDNWRGTRFHLSVSADSEAGPEVVPDGLQGEWLNDRIQGIGRLVSRSPTATASATRASRTPPPPLASYALRRGNQAEFLKACEGVRRRSVR